MDDEMTDNGGSLPAAGRFARIEEALLRIETKLDSKADVVLLGMLEARMLERLSAVEGKVERNHDMIVDQRTTHATTEQILLAMRTAVEQAKRDQDELEEESESTRRFVAMATGALAVGVFVINLLSPFVWNIIGIQP